MRYDHIVDLNQSLESVRDQTRETLAVLRRDRTRLTELQSAIEERIDQLDHQIEAAETFAHLVGQLAATEGPAALAKPEQGKNKKAMAATDEVMKEIEKLQEEQE